MRHNYPQTDTSNSSRRLRAGLAATALLSLFFFVPTAPGTSFWKFGAFMQGVTTKQASSSASFAVSNTNDSGLGSLRQAILDANGAPGSDEINFKLPPGTHTITLTSGELLVLGSITINGPGADLLTISGNNASRVFRIVEGGSATLSDLRIINGRADFGGGIRNEGSATISGSTLSGNSTTSSGGGISNITGFVTISGSTLSGNSAGGNGGGLNNLASPDMVADASIFNSTISGNSANSGGGIASVAVGDPALPSVVLTRIVSSTISGNTAVNGGGIYNHRTSVSINTMQVGNTVLNAGASGSNIFNTATFQSLGFNISSDGGGGFLTGSGDQINTDPLIGALRNNGGTTPTHLPLTGSPTIDKGKVLDALTTDQRGLFRPYDNPSIANALGGDGADIGAVEILAPTSAAVSLGGRVFSAEGMAIRGATVTIYGGSLPDPRTVSTGTFGAFAFGGLRAGETYIVSVHSGRYAFAEPIRTVTLNDDLTDLEFVAAPH